MWRAVLLGVLGLCHGHRQLSLNNVQRQIWGLGQANPASLQTYPYAERKVEWENKWRKTGVVPEKLSEVPPQQLHVEWPNNRFFVKRLQTNETIPTDFMMNRPRLSWLADPSALYTVMIVNNGIERLAGDQYVHWLVVNIPGMDVARGVEVMEYVPPFSYKINKDGTLNTEKKPLREMLILVYKQQGEVVTEETQRGCTPGILTDRIIDKDSLAKKYGMELVAGNFFWCPYSGQATNHLLCRISKCYRKAFPDYTPPLPGINDGEECQPRKEVLDITLRGPIISMRKEYAKQNSLYSPVSITSLIQNIRNVSTGVIREFRSVEGVFDDEPPFEENLKTTLEGDMNAVMFVYKSKETAKVIFKPPTNPPPPYLAAGFAAVFNYLPTLAGGKPYKILISQPEDQDWDVATVLSDRLSIMEMDMVKIRPGQEENFHRLRDKFQAKAINNKYVVSATKFEVDREILEEGDKQSPFYFDSTDNELLISVYRSKQDRLKAFGEYMKDPEFIEEYFSTFDCIACTVLTSVLHPTYYPPY